MTLHGTGSKYFLREELRERLRKRVWVFGTTEWNRYAPIERAGQSITLSY